MLPINDRKKIDAKELQDSFNRRMWISIEILGLYVDNAKAVGFPPERQTDGKFTFQGCSMASFER